MLIFWFSLEAHFTVCLYATIKPCTLYIPPVTCKTFNTHGLRINGWILCFLTRAFSCLWRLKRNTSACRQGAHLTVHIMDAYGYGLHNFK